VTRYVEAVLLGLLATGPAHGYDLNERLAELFPLPDSLPDVSTVYRALDFLVRLGLAHRIESQNAFVACDVGACARSTIFLICERCGRACKVQRRCPSLCRYREERIRISFTPAAEGGISSTGA